MINNVDILNKVAEYLLQINAIKLSPSNPFTWASGLKSPIYCDNRKTLSYPEARDYIRDAFVETVKQKFGDVDVIAGVATGAIALGVLVAQALNKPFVYVRSGAKKHGLENLVEGHLESGQSVVVIEDLVSTGGSSLKAVEALREAGANVKGLLAIFTYGFSQAVDSFNDSKCAWYTLSDYNTMIEIALKTGYIKNEDTILLKKWRENPKNWQD